MKKRAIAGGLLAAVLLVTLVSVEPVRLHVLPRLLAMQPEQVEPIPDLYNLLNFPGNVSIHDLAGSERDQVLHDLMARPEAIQLRMALAEKGFFAKLSGAEVMRVELTGEETRIVEVAVVPMGAGQRIFLPLILRNYSGTAVHLAPVEASSEAPAVSSPEGLSAYLVAMVPVDGTEGFFQAHHTNLDPNLAKVPDPPIIVNDMPYFYVTTLQSIHGRIVSWHYWWYDSNHHPNWYYACYRHYWDYYTHAFYPWPWWHHWVYGWYYWRFWYYWSTWFPWALSAGG